MNEKLLFAATVASLGLTGAAAAETRLSGDITASVTNSEVNFDAAPASKGWVFGPSARVAAPLFGDFAVQVDGAAFVADPDQNAPGIDAGREGLSGTAHGFLRRTDSSGDTGFLLGAFLGGATVDSQQGVVGGFEGEYYLPRVTLGGRLSYGTTDDPGKDGGALLGYAKYFLTDYLAVSGEAGYSSAEFDLGGDDDGFNAAVGVEWRSKQNIPSIFSEFAYSDTDRAERTALTFGLRLAFGPITSLKERNRFGADLDSPGADLISGLER